MATKFFEKLNLKVTPKLYIEVYITKQLLRIWYEKLLRQRFF